MFANLNLPKYNFKLKRIEGIPYIFDIIRKKYVKLTPEEWVRQNLIHYLINEKKYSPLWIAVEKGLTYNKMNKRTDILCYDRTGKPLLIVECKSTSVDINHAVFEQIALYNYELKVPYLLVSNGLTHYCCKMNYLNRNFTFLNDIPIFQ